MTYTIVRPTAFFKSLSGQVARVKGGKPYLVFGDGTLTACKPISDDDLAAYLPSVWLTQAGTTHPSGRRPRAPLSRAATGRTSVPSPGQPRALHARISTEALMALSGGWGTLGRAIPPLGAKAELARIGRYYATESMLVL